MPRLTWFKRFDVRPLLKRGAELLPEILKHVRALQPGEDLIVIAPFVALAADGVAGQPGFASKIERGEGGAWLVYIRARADLV